MGREIGLTCDRCKKGKRKSEIAHVTFEDRTITGKIFERRIIRYCRECFQKDLEKPIPGDKK